MDNTNDVPFRSGVFKATNLGNSGPSRDHLYVMQSADGFIKIGRSRHPRSRAKQLQPARCAAVQLIATFKHRGNDEEAVLALAAHHWAFGEWFHDTPEARAAISAAIGAEIAFLDKITKVYRPTSRNKVWSDAQVREASARSVAKILAAPSRRRRVPFEES